MKNPDSLNGAQSSISEQTGFALSFYLSLFLFVINLIYRCFHTLVRNDRTSCVLTHQPMSCVQGNDTNTGYTSVKIFLFMLTQFCELFCVVVGKLGCCLNVLFIPCSSITIYSLLLSEEVDLVFLSSSVSARG